jgi:hypothetical protein
VQNVAVSAPCSAKIVRFCPKTSLVAEKNKIFSKKNAEKVFFKDK